MIFRPRYSSVGVLALSLTVPLSDRLIVILQYYKSHGKNVKFPIILLRSQKTIKAMTFY